MRLSVIGDEVSQDLDDVIALCKRRGFDGVEVRSVWGRSPLELTREDCRRIANMLQDAELAVVAFASPAFKTPLPRTSRERSRAKRALEQSMDRTTWLGAGIVRVFSFYRSQTPDPESAALEMNEALRVCSADRPFTVAVENGTRTNAPTTRMLCRLLDLIEATPLGVLWDPGNSVFSGFESASWLPAYERVSGRIAHVHLKDPLGTSRYTRFGRGDLDWTAILRRLRADGYGGFLSLETHWRPGRVLTPRERDRPWQNAFSRGGAVSSDHSMNVLARMFQDACS